MSEYIIELQDSGAADEFVAKMGVDDCRIYGYRLNGEIVRCENCKHFTFGSDNDSGSDWCDFHEHIAWSPFGFCAWGKRKE